MKINLISDEKSTTLTQGTDYSVSDRVVTLRNPTSLKIQIYRETTTKPLVGWADASVLRAADMTVQSTQLLHIAEETMDKVQDGGLAQDTTDDVWDARYNRIKNLLDPSDPGDAVTLNYITKNQSSLLTQLKDTGATQNTSIVATGDAQNKRVTDTGDSYVTKITNTGDTQNTRVTTTGDTYVATMTTLKSDATTQAELAKKWAQSDTSPDGVSGNKSSKTWASEAKASASAASTSETNAAASAKQTTLDKAATAANVKSCSGFVEDAKKYQNTIASYITDAQQAAEAASEASVSATTSAANAANSATAAAKSATAASASADKAATFEPEKYYNKLLRNTAYSVGDIAYSLNLPSYLYLECTTAGTTGTSEPDWDITKMGGVNSDGTAQFTLRDIRNHHNVGDIVIKDTTPKDCEYLLPMNGQSFDTTVYVLLAKLYPSGKLPCLNDNRFLEGASTAGTSKDAGLPNITGQFVGAINANSLSNADYTGAFCVKKEVGSKTWGASIDDENYNRLAQFNASSSNAIYGKSNTVQPKSYTVKYYVCYA